METRTLSLPGVELVYDVHGQGGDRPLVLIGQPMGAEGFYALTPHLPDVDALKAAPTRVLLAVGEETGDAFTGRTARATAELLGDEVVVFPGGHGGFGGEDGPWPGQATAFAVRLREVLG